MGADGIAIIAASPERQRNNDVDYPYRADSDFRYLTGFTEPQAIAVLAPGAEHGDYILFCRERNPEQEIWVGRRAGTERAVAEFEADAAYPIDGFDDWLPKLLPGRKRLFMPLSAQPGHKNDLLDALVGQRSQGRRAPNPPEQIIALDPVLHDMRLRKSAAELDLMRQAGVTSARAHRAAMHHAAPGMMEYQLAAILHYEFERDGMTWAYPSIVGGGENACVLHYIENSAPLADGDLVLIDAGAEYRGYASDITRTFPANGRFSEPQRALYDVVLAANRAAIEACVAGAPCNAPHEAALRALVAGLIELGLLEGSIDEAIEQETYRAWFMHGTSHWLGMDVHDVGDYKIDGQWRALGPGMTLTVEPGLYVAAGSDADARFQGIGIRVEDNILVTEGAPEVLTDAVPKDPDAIEALMREARA